MASGSIRVDGLEQLDAALGQVGELFATRWVNNSLRAGTSVLLRGIVPLVPRESGALVSTIRLSSDKNHSTTTRDYAVVIGKHKAEGDPFYANMVDLGTRPHVIKARDGGYMHWGNTYVKSVQHPGSKPDPFMEEGLTQNAQAALGAFTDYLRNKLNIPTLPQALADPT